MCLPHSSSAYLIHIEVHPHLFKATKWCANCCSYSEVIVPQNDAEDSLFLPQQACRCIRAAAVSSDVWMRGWGRMLHFWMAQARPISNTVAKMGCVSLLTPCPSTSRVLQHRQTLHLLYVVG